MQSFLLFSTVARNFSFLLLVIVIVLLYFTRGSWIHLGTSFTVMCDNLLSLASTFAGRFDRVDPDSIMDVFACYDLSRLSSPSIE